VSNIRTLNEHLNYEETDLSPCHRDLLNSITLGIETIDGESAISERSTSFKNSLKSQTSSNFLRWAKRSIFANRALADVDAIYEIDAQIKCDESCGGQHFINLVICLNNREILGTNFLKLDVAASDLIRNNSKVRLFDDNILGVLITLSETTLRRGNWDRSYASGADYSWAFRNVYQSNIRAHIVIIECHYA
jgi:hypothetical protein